MEEKTTDAVRGSFSTGVVAVSWRNDDWRRGSGPFWGGMSSSPVVSGFSNRKSTEAGIPKLTRSKAVNGQMTSVKVNSLNGRFAIRSRFARDSLAIRSQSTKQLNWSPLGMAHVTFGPSASCPSQSSEDRF